MTREEYKKQGWSIIEYDDQLDDVVNLIGAQLKKHGLAIETCNEVCDGFEPVRVISLEDN
jgi:hypothetical protein